MFLNKNLNFNLFEKYLRIALDLTNHKAPRRLETCEVFYMIVTGTCLKDTV